MRFRDEVWPGKGTHSITISYEAERDDGTIWTDYRNTEKDWALLPTSLPVITPPAERRITAEIPGRNGKTEFSKSLTGYPTFGAREGSWKFYYLKEDSEIYGVTRLDEIGYWLSCAADMTKIRVELEDEPGFYYLGRVWVESAPDRQNEHSVLTINYRLYPYKFLCDVNGDWLWDSFNFEYELALEQMQNAELAGKATRHFILPPTDRPSAVIVKVRPKIENMVIGGNAVTVELRKSFGVQYDEARSDQRTASAMILRCGQEVISLEFMIDNDPAYDAYELVVTNLLTNDLLVNVRYEPGYF